MGCSVKKVILKISQNLQENTCASGQQLYLKKDSGRCFLVNFTKFLRKPFSIEHMAAFEGTLGRLVLKEMYLKL